MSAENIDYSSRVPAVIEAFYDMPPFAKSKARGQRFHFYSPNTTFEAAAYAVGSFPLDELSKVERLGRLAAEQISHYGQIELMRQKTAAELNKPFLHEDGVDPQG